MSDFSAAAERVGREKRQQAALAFDEKNIGFGGVDAAEIFAERVARNFAESAGKFNAGGSAADDNEGEFGATPIGIGFLFGAFEGEENAGADFGGVFDGLETGRERGPLRMAEIGVGGAGGDDKRIVGDTGPIAQNQFAG